MWLKWNMPEPSELGRIAKRRGLASESAAAAWFTVYTNLLAIFFKAEWLQNVASRRLRLRRHSVSRIMSKRIPVNHAHPNALRASARVILSQTLIWPECWTALWYVKNGFKKMCILINKEWFRGGGKKNNPKFSCRWGQMHSVAAHQTGRISKLSASFGRWHSWCGFTLEW